MAGRGDELATGSTVGGYRIDALISRGGMGVVYRATNVALGRIYALKVLAPELAGDEHFRERFKREIRIAASLHHPNVVAIHHAGEDGSVLFVAMDLVDGANLTEVIARSGKLDPDRAVGLLEQIASALDAAHGKGLVHRDVKPANILVRVENGQEHAYLTDFGLARRYDTPTALTVQGAVVGTVDYMSPEQITGNHADARSDVYALGCVFFQMITGKVPYRRDHSVATLFAHVNDPPPSLEGSAAASHPTFGPVIAKAMAKDPADRYLSTGDFARDAVAALDGARFTGPPTIVGTGPARPVAADDRDTRPASDDTIHAHPPAASGTEIYAPAAAASGPSVEHTELRSSSAEPAAEESAAVPVDLPPRPPSRETPPVGRRRRWILVVALAVVVVGGAAGAILATMGSSNTTPSSGRPFGSALAPVPDNRVTASGAVTVALRGTLATVTISARGLLNGAPHAMHIHAGGRGVCPPASAARPHNGHITISTTNGIAYYGDTVVSLTTVGDTSPRSIIDFTRYPTTGTISYRRTIRISAKVAAEIRDHNAVVVIHGIDYNDNGVYDNVLDRSDLSNALTGESTAPALCGALGPQGKAQTATANVAGTIYTASLGVREITMPGGSMYWCGPGSTVVLADGSDIAAALGRRAT
jgi:serine/threonine protein kinase